LTASPQVKNADVSTRIIPDHSVGATATDSRSTPATGTTTIAGVQARGTVLFVNSNDSVISVPLGVTFTSTSGVQVQISQSVDVPARHGGRNGTISTSAVALMSGTAGNIPPYTLSTKCCNGLTVSNPYPFSGGVNAHQVHVVSQADVNGVSGPLSSLLQQQVLKQILKKLHPGEVIAEPPVYNTTVAPDSPVGTQVDHVNVQVTASTMVMVYNRNDASFVAGQLLSAQALQALGNSYQLQGTATVDPPRIVKPGKNGIIYLSVTVHEVWLYSFSFQQLKQWKQTIKGDTLVKALAFLNEQPGVAAVQIHLPFGADHLPTSVDQINIALTGK